MNAFYEHHKDNILFGYRCFDRLLLHHLGEHQSAGAGTPIDRRSAIVQIADKNWCEVGVQNRNAGSG